MEDEALKLVPMTNTVELLIKWDFPEEVQLAFLYADIDLTYFLNMGLPRLRDFVPDDRERLRLIKCIFKYKANNGLASTIGPSKKITDTDSASSPSKPEEKSAADSPDEKTSPDSDFDPDDVLIEDSANESDESTRPKCIKKRRKVEKDKPLSEKQNDDGSSSKHQVHQRNNHTEKAALADSSISSRLQAIYAKNIFLNLDLKDHLRKDLRTKGILQNKTHGILSEEKRHALVDSLAYFIVNNTNSPEPADYVALRDKIYELFPNEPKIRHFFTKYL